MNEVGGYQGSQAAYQILMQQHWQVKARYGKMSAAQSEWAMPLIRVVQPLAALRCQSSSFSVG